MNKLINKIALFFQRQELLNENGYQILNQCKKHAQKHICVLMCQKYLDVKTHY